MEFDFENYRYFGHATDKNINAINDGGIRIDTDVYGKSQLESTTIEINENDLVDGVENMLRDVFSIGKSFRKNVAIIGCEIDEYENFYEDVKEKHYIDSEYIIGCYDKDGTFYENENYYTFTI